ncbi:MAG: tRNA preQ1(34) S-adenosylmethionine ribosyltransferase-isomerase QueA [Microscillaceae bacterium]|nr:tRNA preQ1(34) S-adenosylmethionine ribosyltransferase-isomerase QueA [Microscillaceae bacterium]MDW8459921.1 tRNA preQ1(34) S-adenosylmethionine ribosyltransferase-isomerase QueA [Cytophagales bacterium]
MKLSEYKFDLPDNLIALYPAKNRDESRLMVVHRKTGQIEHRLFKDLIDYFGEGDVMVINDTKVFPARMYGSKEKTGAMIEVFLLRELNTQLHLWDVLVDPARKIRVGNKLFFGGGELVAEVIDNTTSRGRTIKFLVEKEGISDKEFYRLIDKLGEAPLPKAIHSRRKAEPADRERFQSIFAKHTGAVAAPAACLHFTRNLVKKLELQGVTFCPITLHIGLGTFRSVDVEDLTKHRSDSEQFEVPEATADIINEAIDKKKKVCAVGASVIKALESSVSADNRVKPNKGWTDKFIFAPYEFKIPNCIITNFHLPESTLLMTTCTFGGHNLIMKAYQEAIKEKYRFFSYGDAMLIL